MRDHIPSSERLNRPTKRLDSVHAQRLTAFSLQPKPLSSYPLYTSGSGWAQGLVDVSTGVLTDYP